VRLYLSKESSQKFKVGDYFYFGSGFQPKKLKSQEVINIKLGVRGVLTDINYQYSRYIRQIISIDGNKLFYEIDNNIEVK